MITLIRSLVRTLVSSIAAMRYLISIQVGVIALGYGFLTYLGYAPFYLYVAQYLRLPPTWLFILLYLTVVIANVAVWYWMVLRGGSTAATQVTMRQAYRQTDRTGLVLYNYVVVAVVLTGALIAPRVFKEAYLIDSMTLLAILILVPIFFDFFPIRRPRRYVVPRPEVTLEEIVDELPSTSPPEEVVSALRTYNELPTPKPGVKVPPLILGQIIEIPPKL